MTFSDGGRFSHRTSSWKTRWRWLSSMLHDAEANTATTTCVSAGGHDPKSDTGVEKMGSAACEREFSNVFCEHKRPFPELPLDHEGRLVGVSVHPLRRHKKIGGHASDGPAGAKF